MSDSSPSLEELLFEVALAKSSEERAAFLDGACRDNPALRPRLEVLLEGHFQAEGFLADGTRNAESKPHIPALLSELVGDALDLFGGKLGLVFESHSFALARPRLLRVLVSMA